MGRPSKYSPKLVELICSGIANGESLRAVCRDIEIDPGTVCGWLAKFADFADRYRVAKEAQADVYAEDIIDYARRVTDPLTDLERLTPEQAKVAIAARQWAAGKTLPKKYGDRVQNDNTHTVLMGDILKQIDGKTRGLPTSD